MLKLALGMMTVALMLSGCTAIQNTVGGGGSSGGTTGGDTGGGSGGDLGTAFQYKSKTALITLNKCSYVASALECDFTAQNIYGSDIFVELTTYSWGVVLPDGNKYTLINHSIDDKTYTSVRLNVFDGFSKKFKSRFSVPSKPSVISFLDGHYWNYEDNDEYFRFKNVPVN